MTERADASNATASNADSQPRPSPVRPTTGSLRSPCKKPEGCCVQSGSGPSLSSWGDLRCGSFARLPTMTPTALVAAARDCRSFAHVPYSKFRAGAAVRTASGDIVPGVIVENVSLGLAMCAERVALFRASKPFRVRASLTSGTGTRRSRRCMSGVRMPTSQVGASADHALQPSSGRSCAADG
jgi:hypothetical protein